MRFIFLKLMSINNCNMLYYLIIGEQFFFEFFSVLQYNKFLSIQRNIYFFSISYYFKIYICNILKGKN